MMLFQPFAETIWGQLVGTFLISMLPRTFLHSIKTVNKLTTLASHRKGCEFAVSFVNFGKMLIDTIQTIIC